MNSLLGCSRRPSTSDYDDIDVYDIDGCFFLVFSFDAGHNFLDLVDSD